MPSTFSANRPNLYNAFTVDYTFVEDTSGAGITGANNLLNVSPLLGHNSPSDRFVCHIEDWRDLDEADVATHDPDTHRYRWYLVSGPDAPRDTPLAGAAGRGPVCELALLRAGASDRERLRGALELFGQHAHTLAAEQGKVIVLVAVVYVLLTALIAAINAGGMTIQLRRSGLVAWPQYILAQLRPPGLHCQKKWYWPS